MISPSLQRYRRKFKKKRKGIMKAKTIIYRATEYDYRTCEYKSQCCPKSSRRIITRSVYQSSREVASAVAKTPVYKKTLRQRKKNEIADGLEEALKIDSLPAPDRKPGWRKGQDRP